MKTSNVVWRATCCGLLAAGVFSTALVMPSASAASSYDVLANAYSVQITARNQSFPIGLVIEGDGPTSQARIDSSGLSGAFASFPYPGDVAAGLPGLSGALFGVPTPAYPFIVSTQYGDDPRDQNFPGISLHSESGAQSASAKSLAGSDTTGSTSTSRAEVLGDGSAQATAQTDFNGLLIGNQLRVRGFHSYARALANGSTGEVVRTTSLSFDQISAPGLEIQIPKNSPSEVPLFSPLPGLPQPPPLSLPPVPLAMGGETIAAPNIGFLNGQFTITLPGAGSQRYAIPAEPVLAGFKQAGVTISVQKPQELEAGVLGAGLDISFSLPAAPENPYFSGETPVTLSIGRSLAIANLRPIRTGGNSSGGVIGGETVQSPPAGGVTGQGMEGVGVVDPPGTVAPRNGTLTGSGPQPDPQVAIGSAPQPRSLDLVGPASDSAKLMGNQISAAEYGDVRNIYLVLIGTGAAAFLVACALRVLGVRFRWGS